MRTLGFVALSGLMFVMAGCGGGPAKATVYPVSGKISAGGKELKECTVQFVSSSTQNAYSSQINADGSYSLVGADGRPGAEAGVYKVVLQMSPQAQMKAMMSGAQSGPPQPGQGAPFDPKYASAETSPKEVEVKAESNTINIEVEAAPAS